MSELQLWTVQMAVVRARGGQRLLNSELIMLANPAGIDAPVVVLDITVKSGGQIGRAFAPARADLRAYQMGRIGWPRYVELYTGRMRNSYTDNWWAWSWALLQSRLALACYCPAEVNCHRYELVDLLVKAAAVNEPPVTVDYRGEIKRAENPQVIQTEQKALF